MIRENELMAERAAIIQANNDVDEREAYLLAYNEVEEGDWVAVLPIEWGGAMEGFYKLMDYADKYGIKHLTCCVVEVKFVGLVKKKNA